jgi:hypothetical protein
MDPKTSFITLYPYRVPLKKIFHRLCSSTTCSSPVGAHPAVPLHQAAPSHATDHLLSALYKAFKSAQLVHIHPEDGNCMFAETDHFQHSMQIILRSQCIMILLGNLKRKGQIMKSYIGF